MADVPLALAEDLAGGEARGRAAALDLSTARVLGAAALDLTATDAGGEAVLGTPGTGLAMAGVVAARLGIIGALLPILPLGAALGLAFGGAAFDL